jgi:hypothetical protein
LKENSSPLEKRLTICLGSIAACSLASSRHPESGELTHGC